MILWKVDRPGTNRRTGTAPSGYPELGALAIVAMTPAILLLWFVPLELVLPLLSITAFVIAGAVALFAYSAGIDRHAPGLNAWDIAALFTVIWILAGLMGGAGALAALSKRLASHFAVNP